MMNFTLPAHYGNVQEPVALELTGKQQVASQGLNVIGQGLSQFFGWKTAQAGSQMQPSQGGGYYAPPPPEPPNYMPVIITGLTLGTLVIGGIVWYNTKAKGKKK